ncbi:MAG: type II secretion system protein M [Gammaproteobacteria bacterium]|nr:type II secretion system protein M [Gammaproteobacteria bacterium]MDH3766891.1 type II secretion system protein M [Gammaproteobacteria bacterium]
MRDQFDRLRDRIDGLTVRERVIVLTAGVVVIVLSWYVLAGEQAMARHERMRAELNNIRTQIADVEARMTQQLPGDGTDSMQARLDDLRTRTATVDGMIQNYAAGLISPVEMARLLERVLERRSSLRLTRLHNIGAEDLLPQDSPGQNRLYRHGLEMELQGPYLAVLAYLEDLEALPWRLYWQVLEIDADDYPMNRIRIEVATLSLHEDWIGV